MPEPAPPPIGSIGWVDLTVPDADSLRGFYSEVVGWTVEPLSMGDYSDYVMKSAETGAGVAGICHRRGPNRAIPPVWLMYIVVAELDASLERCRALGGVVLVPPKEGGGARYAVIRDPAGVVSALYQSEISDQ
jgi:uncharacterized protein